MTKLSIVIAVYNDITGLDAVLRSIFQVPILSEVEVVIIDDGSTFDYQHILTSHSLRNLKYIKQTNGRQGKARNRGILESVGEFIWFVDADDILPIGALQRILELINTRPDVDVLFFNAAYFDWQLRAAARNVEKEELLAGLASNKYTVAPWNKVYSAAFLKNRGIKFPEGKKYEDLFFAIRTVSLMQNWHYADESLYTYQFNLNSTTKKHDQALSDVFYVVRDLELEEGANVGSQGSETQLLDKIWYVHCLKYSLIRLFEARSIQLVTSFFSDPEVRRSVLNRVWRRSFWLYFPITFFYFVMVIAFASTRKEARG